MIYVQSKKKDLNTNTLFQNDQKNMIKLDEKWHDHIKIDHLKDEFVINRYNFVIWSAFPDW